MRVARDQLNYRTGAKTKQGQITETRKLRAEAPVFCLGKKEGALGSCQSG